MSMLSSAFELSVIISAVDKFTRPMKDMENAMKYSQKNMDMITKSMKAMGSSSSEIDKMTKAMDRVARNKAFEELAKDMRAAGAAQSEIDKVAAGMEKLAEQQENLDKMTASFDKFKKVAVTGGAITAVGFKMAEGIAHATEEAGKLLTTLTTIQLATGATDTQMDGIRKSITSTSSVTKYGIMDTGDIAKIVSTSGFNADQTKNLLPVFTKFAEVQEYGKGANHEESVKQAIELAHAMGKYDPKSVDDFLNMYNKGTFMQPEDSAKYGETLKYLIPTAKTLGMSDQDTIFLAALSNRMGLAGSMGGTNAADMLIRAIPGISGGLQQKKDGSYPRQLEAMMKAGLSDSSGNSPFFGADGSIINLGGFIQTLYSHTKSMNDKDRLQEFHDIFGQQGAREAALLGSAQGMEQLKALIEGMQRMGNVDQFQEGFFKTPEGQLKALQSNLNNLKFDVFLEMAKALNPFIEALDGLVQKVIEFSDQHPKIAKYVATFALLTTGFLLVAGPLTSLVGLLGMAKNAMMLLTAEQWLLNVAMDANPVGLIILGIGALVTAGILIYKHWDLVKTKVVEFWKVLQDNPILGFVLGPFFTLIAVAALVSKHWTAINVAFKEVVDYMSKTMKPLIVDVVKTVKSQFGDMQKTVGPIWQQFKTDITAFWNWIGPYVEFYAKAMFDTIKLWFTMLIPVVKFVFDLIVGIVKLYFDVISTVMIVALDLLHGDFSKAWADLTNGWAKMSTDTKGTLSTLGGDLKNIVSSWGPALADYAISIAKDFGSSFGQEMKSQVWMALENTKIAGHSLLDMMPKSMQDAIKPNMMSGPSASKMGPVALHASGGIFNKPHFGMLAEAGAEAYIPLTNRSRGLQVWKQAGAALGVDMLGSRGGDTYNFHLYQQPGQNQEEFARMVAREVGKQTKMSVRNSGARVNISSI